jgi:hypothetical protein
MNDELRRAAAAQRACDAVRELSGDVADTLSGSHGPGDPFTYRGTLLHNLLEAALTLRRAYLAEHPADDGEPVTEGWLASVGFRQTPLKRYTLKLGPVLASPPRGNLWWWAVSIDPDGPCKHIPTPQTRGDVRRLLKALGVGS